ncbi:unnamed protein product [Cunninghamella blakesleeana]
MMRPPNLQQRSIKKTLGEVHTNTQNMPTPNSANTKDDFLTEYKRVQPDYWFRKYKQKISSLRFFLDNIDSKHKPILERKIQLLGGKNEVFYSHNCTHVITSRVFRDELPLKDQDIQLTAEQNKGQENTPGNNGTITDNTDATKIKRRYIARDPIHQNYFDKAQQMNIEIWSIGKALDIFHALIDLPRKRTPTYRLGEMLREEKKYGVNTSQQPGRTSHPEFVPFDSHYLMVEDGAGVNCPIIIRKYKSPEFDKNSSEIDRVYPWPKLYIKQDIKSPFMPPCSKEQQSSKRQKLDDQKQSQQNNNKNNLNDQQQNDQENRIPNNNNNNNINNEVNKNDDQHQLPEEDDNPPSHPHTIIDNTQLSSKTPLPNTVYQTITQQSKSTTTTINHNNISHIITAPHTNDKLQNDVSSTQPQQQQKHFHRPGLPVYENMSRLDRRTISNQRNQMKPLDDITMNSSAVLKKMNKNSNKENSNNNKDDKENKENMTDKENKPSFIKNSNQQSIHSSASTPLNKGQQSLKASYSTEQKQKQKLQEQKQQRNNNNVLGKRTKRAYTKYCENCRVVFEDMDKHMKEDSHIAFIRDKNNFKDLDRILSNILNQTQ